MEIVPFQAAHLETLILQNAQAYFGPLLEDAACGAALEAYPSFSGMVGDTCVGCAGVIRMWGHYGKAWALLSPRAGKHFVAITRAVRGFLGASDFTRIEAAVDVGFDAGCRWAEMLGFRRYAEQPQKGYNPTGLDVWFYARVT